MVRPEPKETELVCVGRGSPLQQELAERVRLLPERKARKSLSIQEISASWEAKFSSTTSLQSDHANASAMTVIANPVFTEGNGNGDSGQLSVRERGCLAEFVGARGAVSGARRAGFVGTKGADSGARRAGFVGTKGAGRGHGARIPERMTADRTSSGADGGR
eukprot:1141705-Prorocentrum_minimum.AAC.2